MEHRVGVAQAMTTSAPEENRPAAGTRAARHHLGPRSITLDSTTVAVAVLVCLQAIWLAVILGRGWYTEADLPNLGAATGQPLDWHYLSASVGGHFGAPGRLMYWLLNRLAPLNWQLTVLIRLLLQLIATLLLWRLLLRLVGRKPWLVALLALYALNPILVPGLAWLTSGLGLAAGQVLVLLMLLAHVRYTRHGRLRHAVLTALQWALNGLKALPDGGTLADQRAKVRDAIETKTTNFVTTHGLYTLSATDHLGFIPTEFAFVVVKDGKFVVLPKDQWK